MKKKLILFMALLAGTMLINNGFCYPPHKYSNRNAKISSDNASFLVHPNKTNKSNFEKLTQQTETIVKKIQKQQKKDIQQNGQQIFNEYTTETTLLKQLDKDFSTNNNVQQSPVQVTKCESQESDNESLQSSSYESDDPDNEYLKSDNESLQHSSNLRSLPTKKTIKYYGGLSLAAYIAIGFLEYINL